MIQDSCLEFTDVSVYLYLFLDDELMRPLEWNEGMSLTAIKSRQKFDLQNDSEISCFIEPDYISAANWKRQS